jgi:hypothetical protein
MWQDIHLTIIPRVDNTLLHNMTRFKNKQCADPLDMVYSLLTISIDGPKLQVAYGISRLELAHKMFHFLGDALCLWRARTVLDNLQIPFDEGDLQSTDFVDLETRRYDWPLEENQRTCPSCGKCFDKTSQKDLRLRQSYMYCLKCPHPITSDSECSELWQHILFAETTVDEVRGWRFFLMGATFIPVIENDVGIVAFGVEDLPTIPFAPGVIRIPLQTISSLYKALTSDCAEINSLI